MVVTNHLLTRMILQVSHPDLKVDGSDDFFLFFNGTIIVNSPLNKADDFLGVSVA